jgi:hypothetical protein
MAGASSSTDARSPGKETPSRLVRRLSPERIVMSLLLMVTALSVGILVGRALRASFSWPPVTWISYIGIRQGMIRSAVEDRLGPPGDYTSGPTESESLPASTDLWSPDALGSPHAALWQFDDATIHVAFDEHGFVIGKSFFRSKPRVYGPPESFWRTIQKLWRRWFD